MPLELLLAFLLTWSLLFATFSGIGLWLLAAFGLRADTGERWFLAFWAGFCGTIALLQLWHFAWPVNDAARVLLLAIALAGLMVHGRAAAPALRHPPALQVVFALLMLLVAVWLANRSIRFPHNVWDTGYYHVKAVEWASAYAVVPGLGNLHSRLGHSTAFFLYGALLNTGFWELRTFHIANSFLLLVVFAQMAASLFALGRAREFQLRRVFDAAFVPVFAWLMMAQSWSPKALTPVPTLSNDPAVFILGVVTASQLLALITQDDEPVRLARFRLFLIVLMSTVGTAIKFNHLVPGGLMALLALAVFVQRHAPATALRETAKMALVAALVLGPMCARTVIYTGYPAYPSTVAPFPVDWRIDPAVAAQELHFIQAFARDMESKPPHNAPTTGWVWLPKWTEENLTVHLSLNNLYFVLPLGLSVVAGAFLAALRLVPALRRRSGSVRPALWGLPAIMLLSLCFWFMVAPAIRFAGASWWILGIGTAAVVVEVLARDLPRWLVTAYCVALIAAVPMPFVSSASLLPWTPPATGDGLYRLDEPHELWRFTTDSGLEVWYPPLNTKCWFAPLPCTPFPHPKLRLRVPGDLSQGFDIDLEPDDPPRPID